MPVYAHMLEGTYLGQLWNLEHRNAERNAEQNAERK